MKIGIGIDIDDTLTNLFDVFVSYGFLFAYKNNIDIKELFINGYEALDTFNFTPEQDKLFQTTYLSKILNQVKPRPLASEVINELKNQFDIYIITSRNDELMKDCKINTEKWLKNNNIYYNMYKNEIRWDIHNNSSKKSRRKNRRFFTFNII